MIWAFCCALSLLAVPGHSQLGSLGAFEDHADVGLVLQPGSVTFNQTIASYTISAGGEKIGDASDTFHFLWKKSSGDISLTTSVAFPVNTGNSDKEAALLIRQNLSPEAPYIAAIWGVTGLKSMRWRREKGAATVETMIDAEAVTQVRLEKRGTHFFVYIARKGEKLHPAAAALPFDLAEPFYIGLGVCAYDKDALESAVFSNVQIAAPSEKKLTLYSTLEIIDIASAQRRVVAVIPGRIENPSFTLDGAALLFKQRNKLQQIPVAGGKFTPATEPAVANVWKPTDKPSPNQQHQAHLSYWGAKPQDGILSIQSPAGGNTKELAEIVGGEGTLSDAPWSPDSQSLVFVSYQRVPQE